MTNGVGVAVNGGWQNQKFQFDIVDYAVFGAMLLLSALTGLYYGCRSRYCKTGEAPTLREYLTGSGNMKPFPVAMSLVASYISGVTILGTPAEIYNFGTQYWLIVVAIWISGIVVAIVYVPVFCKLQVNSSYEYLELRFNRYVRTLASVLFVLDEIMFLPILIYVPSLAFNQVTGIDIHLIGTIVCVVCIFYTVLGGLKAVVWTDTWQIIVMFLSVVVVVALGTSSLGGAAYVWERSSSRILISNFNPSPYERHTVFGVIIGGFIYWTSFNAVNQTMVQRYLSLPTENQAKMSVAIFTVGVSVFVSVCCFTGLIIYATYFDCDPLTAGRIRANDQLLPLFVMETVGHLRGVPGLFIAGVFGAALSSLSVILNSTSMVIYFIYFV
ncbi:Sodium:solute symporter family [Popillia japonica]|uniref:Sodium:solute symporter family n=1 Tax=Popillia japonica TaxID=7064 RepID=A0AAW1LRZ0_POPJA